MNAQKIEALLDKSYDIDAVLTGVFLGGEVRAYWDRWGGWQAYLVTYKKHGNIKDIRVIRIKKGKRKGKPVRTSYYWEGVTDLAPAGVRNSR